MRIIDLLTEAVSSVVYHYTNLDAAARILTSGEFALSSTLGSIEEKFAPKGYPYFLSTTRTRRGGYHSNAIGDGAAMFNLDGNYYNQRYRGGPIDYWGDRHNDYGRAAEAEDRIFSKEPTMSAGGITSVHIFVKPLPVAAVPGSSVDIRARESISSFAARARTALLAAKKAGIPAYLYEDRLGWVNQDPKARIAITGSRDTLRGQIPMYNPSHPPRQYMAKWLELIYKDSTKALSTQNFGDLHSLIYNDPYWLKEMVTSLSADLSNARKPSAGADREVAVKIISYMNRHGLHTVTDFIMALRKKWTIIKNKEQEAKYDAEQADYAKFQAKEKAAQPELAESARLNEEVDRGVIYTKPDFEREWEEAARYPEFKQLGREAWVDIAAQGRIVDWSSLDNVGNVELDLASLDQNKVQSVAVDVKRNHVELPIVGQWADGTLDLIAGNTRIATLLAQGHNPKVWLVDVPGDLNES